MCSVAFGSVHQLSGKPLVGITISKSPTDEEIIFVASVTSQRLQSAFPLGKPWPNESYCVIFITKNGDIQELIKFEGLGQIFELQVGDLRTSSMASALSSGRYTSCLALDWHASMKPPLGSNILFHTGLAIRMTAEDTTRVV